MGASSNKHIEEIIEISNCIESGLKFLDKAGYKKNFFTVGERVNLRLQVHNLCDRNVFIEYIKLTGLTDEVVSATNTDKFIDRYPINKTLLPGKEYEFPFEFKFKDAGRYKISALLKIKEIPEEVPLSTVTINVVYPPNFEFDINAKSQPRGVDVKYLVVPQRKYNLVITVENKNSHEIFLEKITGLLTINARVEEADAVGHYKIESNLDAFDETHFPLTLCITSEGEGKLTPRLIYKVGETKFVVAAKRIFLNSQTTHGEPLPVLGTNVSTTPQEDVATGLENIETIETPITTESQEDEELATSKKEIIFIAKLVTNKEEGYQELRFFIKNLSEGEYIELQSIDGWAHLGIDTKLLSTKNETIRIPNSIIFMDLTLNSKDVTETNPFEILRISNPEPLLKEDIKTFLKVNYILHLSDMRVHKTTGVHIE